MEELKEVLPCLLAFVGTEIGVLVLFVFSFVEWRKKHPGYFKDSPASEDVRTYNRKIAFAFWEVVLWLMAFWAYLCHLAYGEWGVYIAPVCLLGCCFCVYKCLLQK